MAAAKWIRCEAMIRQVVGRDEIAMVSDDRSDDDNGDDASRVELWRPDPSSDEFEARRVLVARVGRRGGVLPASLLVRQVMNLVPASEWPVRVEAMDALLRRLDMARKDELVLDTRPSDHAALGPYTTRRKGSDTRPYRTTLSGVDPIRASCDCPDFLKSSLVVCKHAFAVLEAIYKDPDRLKAAQAEQAARPELREPSWDPVRPLTGAGDWLERIELPASGRRGTRWERACSHFRHERGGSRLRPRRPVPHTLARRLAMVEDVLKVTPDPAGDPALRALLLRERSRLSGLVKQSLPPGDRKRALRGLKRPLYPYQREGVDRFLDVGRLLLADDMGLGKTAQAIACCEALWQSGRVRRALIICPASLKPQWAREWATFSDLPIEVIDGTPTERRALYEGRKSGLFIINYEQLLRDLDVVRAWAPHLVVLDEAQRIKNWATKTALSVKGLTPPYRLVLTGTPMENRIDELASIVEWVDDHALEPRWRLSAFHTIRADGKKEVTGVRHLDTLRTRLEGCMLRRIRQDVLDQLPPRTDVRVPVDLTLEQQEQHDDLFQPIAKLMGTAQKRPLTQAEFLKLMSLLTTQRIICNGLAQLQFEERWPSIRSQAPTDSILQGLFAPKLRELQQLLRQVVIDQGRKVVVFSQWRRMLTLAHWAVRPVLAEQSLRAGFFTGQEGTRRRTQNIVEFHDDPDCRVLFATDAGGVGLNLQHASNCVVNLELPWNPAVLEQRIGRVYRLGQTQPIDVFNLVSESGIESRIATLVGSKQAFFKGLFDGESDSVQFEQSGSFLSRVEKLYEDLQRPVLTGEEVSADDLPDATTLDDDVEMDPQDDGLDILVDSADESADPAQLTPAGETPVAVSVGMSIGQSDPAVASLFSQLRVERRADGGVTIDAPPEAAASLASLFEAMTALMRAVAAPHSSPPPESKLAGKD
jgi:hypothetical protein